METCKPVVSCVCPPSTAGGGGGGGGGGGVMRYARCRKALPPCTMWGWGYICIVLACSVPKSLTTIYHFY